MGFCSRRGEREITGEGNGPKNTESCEGWRVRTCGRANARNGKGEKLVNSISEVVFSVNIAWDIAIKSNTLYGFKLEHQIKHIGTTKMVEKVNEE